MAGGAVIVKEAGGVLFDPCVTHFIPETALYVADGMFLLALKNEGFLNQIINYTLVK